MWLVQMLKFSQHHDLQKQLIETGDRPLLYSQLQTSSECKKDKLLDYMANQLFVGTANPSKLGQPGQPLPGDWGTLLHPDDIYWGVDPLLDPKGEVSNEL
jgi:hypothetical protein